MLAAPRLTSAAQTGFNTHAHSHTYTQRSLAFKATFFDSLWFVNYILRPDISLSWPDKEQTA